MKKLDKRINERNEERDKVKSQKQALLQKMRSKQGENKEGKKKATVDKKKQGSLTEQQKHMQSEIDRLKLLVSKQEKELVAERRRTADKKKQLKLREARLDQAYADREEELENKTFALKEREEALISKGQLYDELDLAIDRSVLEQIEERNAAIYFLMKKVWDMEGDRRRNEMRVSSYKGVARAAKRELAQDVNSKQQKIDQLERTSHRQEKQLSGLRVQVENRSKRDRKMRDSIKKLNQQLRKARSIQANGMIDKLIRNLNPQNLQDYGNVNRLLDKYQGVFEYVSEYGDKESGALFGYIEKGTEDWRFTDINEEVVASLHYHSRYEELLMDGLAVQVFRDFQDPKSVNLGYIYDHVEKRTEAQRKRRKKQRETREELQYIVNSDVLDWAKGISVAVIGNKQVKPFIGHLDKYVAEVTWVDPFERSERDTFRLMHEADYCFVLTGSAPHYVMNFLRNNYELEDKSELFYGHRGEDGVIRLNYLYWSQKYNED